jgi:hypothetical protein
MLLQCKLCEQLFKSLVIPQEKALSDVVGQIGNHMAKHHPAALQAYIAEIGALARALDATLLSKRLVKIPPSEVFAQSVADGGEKIILNALGIEDNEIVDEPNPSKKLESNPENAPVAAP